ncbi:unnamed protein product [Linum trigynum]|uniref:Uncharacterized protein n=1 Tax=Linum trigynum TaxID=586398 RepID=A0AAV2EAQ6_9ROSI
MGHSTEGAQPRSDQKNEELADFSGCVEGLPPVASCVGNVVLGTHEEGDEPECSGSDAGESFGEVQSASSGTGEVVVITRSSSSSTSAGEEGREVAG